MKSIELTNQTGDWLAILAAITASGDPAALTLDGTLCGILLPELEARRVIAGRGECGKENALAGQHARNIA